jgi:tetratricopeptide (TPR) repeat protein
MKNASCKNSMKIDLERNRIAAIGQSFRAALLLMVMFLLFPVQSLAASKVFEREYTYSASEADSKLTCRVIALEQVKRLLLEELGTYLHSISEVKDGVLTKDEIVSLTAGVVRTEIISEHWDGKVYRLKARIKADPDYAIKAIDLLRKDRQKSKDLEESQARAKQYLNEIERLKQELTKAKGEALKRKQIEYSKVVKNLSAEDWFEKGNSFRIFNQYEEAIMAYTRALNINPRFADAYNNRGLARADKGNYDRSIADYNSALEINPRYALAYYNRGGVWVDKGDYDSAIADFNKALEINPRFAEAYSGRGVTWAYKGDYDSAIADFNSALEINPHYALAYSNRALAWADKGDFWQASADARKGLSLNPESKRCQKVVDLLKAKMRDKR